jgi:hypothetical protein
VTSYDRLLRQKIGKRWRFHKEAIDRWVQSGNPQGDSEAAEKEE